MHGSCSQPREGALTLVPAAEGGGGAIRLLHDLQVVRFRSETQGRRPRRREDSMHTAETQRVRLLVQLQRLLERPLFVLSLVWVVLAVIELARGLSRTGEIATFAIWMVFIADFGLEFAVAPRKLLFVRKHWLSALSLLLPALRLMRIARLFRVARAARGVRLAKLLGSINRGIRALRHGLRRRGAGYVTAATILVLLTGAAGMMAFETGGPTAEAFDTYPDALWWTAMLMTTIASETWPATGAGRTLTLFLSLYSISVFGYVTATLASLLVEQNVRPDRPVEQRRP
jgi:voltage-gated potassium channel